MKAFLPVSGGQVAEVMALHAATIGTAEPARSQDPIRLDRTLSPEGTAQAMPMALRRPSDAITNLRTTK
jgi:hypothetical protein